MIDNYNLIKPLLRWDDEDQFYFINVMQRKKEHPHLGNNSYVVKSYFIKDEAQLERQYPEMKGIAELMNARVYINLNRRSFENLAFQTFKKMSDMMMNKEWKSFKKAYTSVCGSFTSEEKGAKTWILDIDDKDFPEEAISSILSMIEPHGEKVIAKIPTKHGYHLITKPFNTNEFRKYYEVDIQKNNPTVLYIP